MKIIFKRFENLTSAELWDIRLKVVVNSVYINDFENQYGINEVSLCNFFEGYYDFICELAEEKIGKNIAHSLVLPHFDNEENLYRWFNCYDDFDWIVYNYDEDIKDLAKSIIVDEEFDNDLSIEQIEKIIFKILQDKKYTLNELCDLYLYSNKINNLLKKYTTFNN